MSAYIKKISDGVISFSCSTQTVTNPAHLKILQAFLTSRGLLLSDYTIADATEAEIQVMIEDAITLDEKWMNDMRDTDGDMPRYLEDLITVNSLTMTPEMKVRYDAKIKKREEQP